MPDFAMDYDTLYALQSGMNALADTANGANPENSTELFDVMGHASQSDNEAVFGHLAVATGFDVFYRVSMRRTEDGIDRLREFANVFGGVADALFQQDGQIAADAVTASAGGQFNDWVDARDRHDQWVADKEAWDAYVEGIGAGDYFRDHPDAVIGEVCSVDSPPGWCETWSDDLGSDDPPPVQPGPEPEMPEGEPPTSFTATSPDGSVSETTLTYDDDYNIVTETTTVHGPEGETYTTTREFHGPPEHVDPPDSDPESPTPPFSVRDYTDTTIGPDGTETVEEVVIDDEDGSATRTTTTTSLDEDGNEEVETEVSTRSGPDADWVAQDGDEDDD